MFVRVVSDLLKELFDILVRNCRSLNIFECFAGLDPVGHHLLVLNLARAAMLVAQVRFIADKYDRREILRVFLTHRPIVGRGTLKKVISPDVDALITLPIRQVEYDNAAVSAAIERV